MKYFILWLSLLMPLSALAHSKAIFTSPENAATLASAPEVVTIKFNKPIESSFNQADIWYGNTWVTLPATISGKTLTIQLKGTNLKSYRIRWSVISQDGHRQRGVLNFSVK